MPRNKSNKSLLQQFVEMSHIDQTAVESVDRNIRACFPKLSENEIERMVIRNLTANLDYCRETEAALPPPQDRGPHR